MKLKKNRSSRSFIRRMLYLFAGVMFGLSAYGLVPVSVRDLKCECLVNPLGIDAQHPRLSWYLKDNRQGARQIAYSLYVSTDSAGLIGNKTNVWQTGKVNSDNMRISYHGAHLQTLTKCYWKIEVWDNSGKYTLSHIASFETGLLNENNWKGAWISDNNNISFKPAPYFRNVFNIEKKSNQRGPISQLLDCMSYI